MEADSIVAPWGALTIACVLVAILSRRLSPLAALVLVPILASLAGGLGLRTSGFIISGIESMASVISMFVFAILFFGVLIRVSDLFSSSISRSVERYSIPGLGALNFVLHRPASESVTRSLALDVHGKTLSFALLNLDSDPSGGHKQVPHPPE